MSAPVQKNVEQPAASVHVSSAEADACRTKLVEAVPAMFKQHASWGKAAIILYICVIVAISFIFIRPREPLSFKSARSMGANTLLTEADLVAPGQMRLGDEMRIRKLREQLVGSYVKHDLERDTIISPADVLKWPDLKNVPTTPVVVAGDKPELSLINQGALVEIAIEVKRKSVEVVAIIPQGEKKWAALFRSDDVGDISKAAPTITRIIRLPVLSPTKTEAAVAPRIASSPGKE